METSNGGEKEFTWTLNFGDIVSDDKGRKLVRFLTSSGRKITFFARKK